MQIFRSPNTFYLFYFLIGILLLYLYFSFSIIIFHYSIHSFYKSSFEHFSRVSISRITFRSPSILSNSRARVLSKYLATENCYFHLARAKYKEDSRTAVKFRFIISTLLSRPRIQRAISEAQYKQSEIQSNFSPPRNPFSVQLFFIIFFFFFFCRNT